MTIDLDIFSKKPKKTNDGFLYISERPNNHYDWSKEKEIVLVEKILIEFLDKKNFLLALDSGSGNGRCTEPLSKICNKIIALDSSYEGLRQLKMRNLKNVYPLVSAESKLPFKDNIFDLISCITVIEHIPPDDAINFLKEHFRVLKPGGRFIIRNDAWAYGIYEKFIGFKSLDGQRKPPDPTHINMITPRKLQKQLEDIGFTVINKSYFPFYRYKLNNFPLADIFATKGNFVCIKNQ